MVLLPALTGAFGDRPDAVTVGDQSMSWQELRECAAAVAERITGAPAVAVHASATLQTVIATVAGLLAGVPVVPIPPDSGPRERNHLLTDSGATLILTGPEPVPSDAGVPLLTVDPTARSGWTAEEPPAESTALVLYTSGTTGRPKGVRLSRRAIAADLDALAEAWQWTPADVLAHGLPLYHVHGLVLGVLGALRVGSALTHTVRPTPAKYAAAGGTLYFGVPTVWSRVCAQPAAARALRRARLLVSGSAALPVPVFAGLRALAGQTPVERYGMTETLITLSTRVTGPRQPGRVGTPLAGITTRLVDDRGEPLPPGDGQVGELQVRGATLFDGYLNQPEATRSAYTADGWFRTGDAASIDADGVHRIVGRMSVDLIKTGGFRVGAGEVEDALLAHPAVREAAVIGAPHPDLGAEIVAYVVADGVTPPELIEFVASELSVHKRPRRVQLVDALPRNAMGKVVKQRLAEA